MKGEEAKVLLGLSPNSGLTVAEIKAAYRRKVWECHPDLFQSHPHKPLAESNFKLISEAYALLLSGDRGGEDRRKWRAVKGSKRQALVGVPFLLLVLATASLGGCNAVRSYKKEQKSYPSHNPFLP